MAKKVIIILFIAMFFLSGCSDNITPIIFPQMLGSYSLEVNSITFEISEGSEVIGNDVNFYKLVPGKASESEVVDVICKICKYDRDKIVYGINLIFEDYGGFMFTAGYPGEPTKLKDDEVKEIASSILEKYGIFNGEFACRPKVGYSETESNSVTTIGDKTAYFDRLIDGCKVYGQAASITVYDDRIGNVSYLCNDFEKDRTVKSLSLENIKKLDPFSVGQLSFPTRKDSSPRTANVLFNIKSI